MIQIFPLVYLSPESMYVNIVPILFVFVQSSLDFTPFFHSTICLYRTFFFFLLLLITTIKKIKIYIEQKHPFWCYRKLTEANSTSCAQPCMCSLRVCLYACRLSRFFNSALKTAYLCPGSEGIWFFDLCTMNAYGWNYYFIKFITLLY